MKIGKYTVKKEGENFVARTANCPTCNGPCVLEATRATRAQIKKILSGKSVKLNYSVTYLCPKIVSVGCTIVRRSQLEKLLAG